MQLELEKRDEHGTCWAHSDWAAFLYQLFSLTHPNNFIIVEINGPWRLENGLVGPGKLTAFTKSAETGQTLKEQKTRMKELCKHMEKERMEAENKLVYSPAAVLVPLYLKVKKV